ncbi:hypothetical protein Bdt_0186 [Bdellovibrio bacteriovorus str. Tiberius]|uniref:Uncharacterized protein n=1 Tax=Bdellovibrio bacteriovorus str. Tiberius TaxID=1069642 RepID=K7YJQ8_BDEBC|nr:hypothetical protein Bdt_0186 [Bdellovibrio bacteriovorus str. Tiberius]
MRSHYQGATWDLLPGFFSSLGKDVHIIDGFSAHKFS